MGSSESKSTEEYIKFMKANHLVVKRLDPRYGVILIIEDTKTSALYLIKEFQGQDKLLGGAAGSELKKLKIQGNRSHLILPNNYFIAENNMVCSNFYIHCLVFEWRKMTLDDEIKNNIIEYKKSGEV